VRALRAGIAASRPLAEPPGAYCLSLLVFDHGDHGVQTLDVRVGGTVVTQTWSGAVPGIRDLEVAVRAGSTPRQLSYAVPAGSTLGVIVDRITLYPPASGETCGPTPST
jgi:hypothetical protein